MLYYFNRLLTFIIIFGGMDMEPQKKLSSSLAHGAKAEKFPVGLSLRLRYR